MPKLSSAACGKNQGQQQRHQIQHQEGDPSWRGDIGQYASTSIRGCSSCIAPTRQQRNIRTTQNPGSISRNLAAYQAEKRHAEVRNTPLRTTGTPLLTNENWLFDHMPRHRGGAGRACSSFSQIEPYDGFAAGGRFRNWPERMAVHHLKRQAQLPI